jgi:ribose 5-phosphate isomerase B
LSEAGREIVMKVAVACDHGGLPLKQMIFETVRAAGHTVVEVAVPNSDTDDYPDFAEAVGRLIVQGAAKRGILVCGSGVGACIAANKMRGVYACVCHDTYSAHQGVEHDDMNVLCIGARVIGPELARELVPAFLGAKFSNAERHARRVQEIRRLESGPEGLPRCPPIRLSG